MATNEKAGTEVPPTSNAGVGNAFNNETKDTKGSDTASVLKEAALGGEVALLDDGELLLEDGGGI